MKRRHLWAPALVVATALAGCTPEVAELTPTPTPTTVTPRPETDEQRTQRLAYEAAERSYRAFNAELNKVMAAGGAERATATMKRYAAGDYLEFQENQIAGIHSVRRKAVGGAKIRSLQQTGYKPGEVGLRSCEDARGVRVVDESGKVIGRGIAAVVDLQIREISNSWKISDAQYRVVPNCDNY